MRGERRGQEQGGEFGGGRRTGEKEERDRGREKKKTVEKFKLFAFVFEALKNGFLSSPFLCALQPAECPEYPEHSILIYASTLAMTSVWTMETPHLSFSSSMW